MNLNVDIDPASGFCQGVVRAIRQAEEYLEGHDSLYSLGAIVHNDTEISRLSSKGLKIIGYSQLETMHDDVVFIRAHGEPPQTYLTAERNGLQVIDCTCPVVLKLQKRIRQTHQQVLSEGGMILIFGKKGHAEVNGLMGNAGGDALIVEDASELEGLELRLPLHIFSQTTRDPEQYRQLCDAVLSRFPGREGQVHVNDTICRQVASRYGLLEAYASSHDVILFVSGGASSNGKVLFNFCRSVNSRSHHIENPSQIQREWFTEGCSVGICGATSTPAWQLQQVADYLALL